MRKRTQARECALQILYQVDVTKDSPDKVLPTYWEFHPTPEDIRQFTELIVRGTSEHLGEIDQKIIQYTENWELNRMATVDRNVLRLAVYELLYLDDIPPKVTINEAVNIAKKFSQEDAGKFVNGILDKINHTEVTKPGSASSEERSPS